MCSGIARTLVHFGMEGAMNSFPVPVSPPGAVNFFPLRVRGSFFPCLVILEFSLAGIPSLSCLSTGLGCNDFKGRKAHFQLSKPQRR